MKVTPKFIEERATDKGGVYYVVHWDGGKANTWKDDGLFPLLKVGVEAEIETKASGPDNKYLAITSVNGQQAQRKGRQEGGGSFRGRSPEDERRIVRQSCLGYAIAFLGLVSDKGIYFEQKEGKVVNVSRAHLKSLAEELETWVYRGSETKEAPKE